MTRRLASLTLDNLDDLPSTCRRCVFWEATPEAVLSALALPDPADAALDKEVWVSATLLQWGSCGAITYVESEPVGYALYAPPALVPRAFTFPTSPVSPDAVLLITAHVSPLHRGGGIGRMLVQGAAKDLLRRGIRALEALGDARWERPSCILPADYLLSIGFKTVRLHYRWPRLRLDLRSTLSWREDVEAALERIMGAMTPEPAIRPV